MKIAMMGSGGIGGYYGGRLAQAGEDVTFIARGAHLAALRAGGLRVFSHYGDFSLPQVNATDDPAAVGPVELVVMATKAYDLEAASAAMRPLIGPHTTVLPLLNGVDIAERIGAVVGAQHVLGGLCGISSALDGPGVIRQVSPFEFVQLGELHLRRTPRAEAAEAAFKRAGTQVELVADIRRALWDKFLFLTAVAGVCSVTGQVLGAVRADPDTRALLADCLAEIVAVARAEGIAYDDASAAEVLKQVDVRPAALKPSMMLDLERGKPLELEALHGTVVRLGAAHGVATPANAFIYAALKGRAHGAG
jgi:2-dehydropantoate 2-reductase